MQILGLKVLLVVAVVAVVVALLLGRRRQDASPTDPSLRRRGGGQPLQMVSCARCGVHLPEGEALRDAAGRAFCSEAHRRDGPR